jgi:hypothetical protein
MRSLVRLNRRLRVNQRFRQIRIASRFSRQHLRPDRTSRAFHLAAL